MRSHPRSDAHLRNASAAMSDLAHHLAHHVLNKPRSHAAGEQTLMDHVHHKLGAVCLAISAINRDKDTVSRIVDFEREREGTTHYVHQLGADPEVISFRVQAKQLADVLSAILLSKTTRSWFWAALAQQYAIPVTVMSGLKQREPWHKVLKKLLVGMAFGAAQLPPPEFDIMYVDDDEPANVFQHPTVQRIFASVEIIG
jgi:hypothetical protein